jgi:hypothetical protein
MVNGDVQVSTHRASRKQSKLLVMESVLGMVGDVEERASGRTYWRGLLVENKVRSSSTAQRTRDWRTPRRVVILARARVNLTKRPIRNRARGQVGLGVHDLLTAQRDGAPVEEDLRFVPERLAAATIQKVRARRELGSNRSLR